MKELRSFLGNLVLVLACNIVLTSVKKGIASVLLL